MTSWRSCLLTTPGCPPLTTIDPGWSMMLSPLALFTTRPGPFQAFSALLLAAAPAALWAWLRRRTDEAAALLAAALFASCPLVLAQSGVVMSEVPYILLLLGTMAAAESGRAALTGASAAALVLTRTAGLSALPGLLLPFARARRLRDLARAAIPPALAAGAWAAWCWSKIGSMSKFNLLPSTYGGARWTKPAAVAAANARWYLGEWGGCFLPPSRADGALAAALGAALAAVTA